MGDRETPAGEESSSLPGQDSPPSGGKNRRRLFLAIPAAVLLVLVLAGLEARTSWLQSRWFSRLAGEATYRLVEGAAPEPRYPGAGPYDLRLGYTRLPLMMKQADSLGYHVVSQARTSDGFKKLQDWGVFPIYREKARAGLVLRDQGGRVFLESYHPAEIYLAFDSVPPIVTDALLFIENRELLSPRRSRLNPAVEWDRLARNVGALALRQIGFESDVAGASTLATQIEKYRHSPEGRTTSVSEKLRQMASASIRAYMDGPTTLEARKRILTDYLNSVPLAAARGHGEVVGLADGLWAWYGTEFQDVNRLLRADPDTLSEELRVRYPEILRQTLSLMVAQRRPSFYLTSGSGQEALGALTDQYIRLMMRDGIIPRGVGAAMLEAHIQPLVEAPAVAPPTFSERKGQNQIRSRLLSLLGVAQLYDLDRMDLAVEATLDMTRQEAATALLSRMEDPAYVRDSGLGGFRLLDRGDPSRVIYSFTLSERTAEGNRIRIQTDNFDGPFNINEGSRIELGSSAKLRTLVTYLEVVEGLHYIYSDLPPDSLRRLVIPPQDRLAQWMVDLLATQSGATLDETLQASLRRPYSASPNERFLTGGGTQTFANFDAADDGRVLTVQEGFTHSVNLVWVRVMRDILNHLIYGDPNSTARALEDAEGALRQEYLSRFADREGGVFVDQFYQKYGQAPPDSIPALMVQGRRLTPIRMAWAYRWVVPEASAAELAHFIDTNALNTHLAAGSAEDLYRRTAPEGQTLADVGYLASIHPLELWVGRYLLEHPGASRRAVLDASRPVRQEVYGWLFRTSRRNAQDLRIRSMLELEAFSEVLQMWKRVGYPFENLVPSLGTSIGSSGDRPSALAELVGVIVNDGVRKPSWRVEELNFATGTPFEVNLRRKSADGERVLSSEVARVAREALLDVVNQGTGVRIRGALKDSTGLVIPIGGKTGTGDNRFRVFAPGGRMVESRAVNRTSAFVFFLGDRYFGVITAYVPGPEAEDFGFTSSLPLEVLKRLLAELDLFGS